MTLQQEAAPAASDCSPSTLFTLEGRVAMLTGAGGYLGRAIALSLAAAGATVHLCGRTASTLELCRDAIRAAGGQAEMHAFDVTDGTAAGAAVAAIAARNGRIDVLVNNAYAGATGTLASAEAADYQAAFAIGLAAPALLTKTATPYLAAAATAACPASVVNVASMYGLVSPDPAIYGDSGHDNPPYYGAVKAGLLQFTRYAAVHLASQHIRVNALTPGAFPPPRLAETMPALWRALNDKPPMKRVGVPEELQGPIVFLASNASRYVTGATIVVDGGWTAW